MGLPLVVTVNEMSNKGDECSFCHRGKVISVNIHIYIYLSKLQLLHKLSNKILPQCFREFIPNSTQSLECPQALQFNM